MIFKCEVVHETNFSLRYVASVAYLDKHSTLDLVMVSVVSSNPSGWRQFFAEMF